MLNPLKYFRNRKVGLALGSGGAKGLAHISVIEYLNELKIPVDMIAGSSIGALIGAIYCCGNLARIKSDMLAFSKKELLAIADPVFPRSGFIKGDGFIKFMKNYIPADALLEEMPVALTIVATDYYSGRPVVFRKGNILKILRGSTSIPGVFIPVRYNNTFLLDGGVSNPIPLDVVKKMGAGLTVAVNLHPGLKISGMKNFINDRIERFRNFTDTDDYQNFEEIAEKTYSDKNSSGWFKSIEKWIPGNKSIRSYPNIFEIFTQTIDIMEYVNTLNTLRYNPPTVLIEPELLQIGTLDFHESGKIFSGGLLACEKKRSEILMKIKFWV